MNKSEKGEKKCPVNESFNKFAIIIQFEMFQQFQKHFKKTYLSVKPEKKTFI